MTDLIDIDAYAEMVAGVPIAAGRMQTLEDNLRAAVLKAKGIASPGNHVPDVLFAGMDDGIKKVLDRGEWMKTRLELARAVAAQPSPDFGGVVVPPGSKVCIDDSIISTVTDLADAANAGTLTDEQWQTIISMSQSNSPEAAWFAAHFNNSVDPQKLAELTQKMSDRMGSPPDGQKQYNSRVAALGDLLGKATSSKFPPLRDDYAQDVITVLKTSANPASVGPALSLVLSHGTYDTTFAVTVAEGMYTYETSPEFQSMGWNLQYPRMNPVRDEDGRFRVDPVVGVMAMLANNPQASAAFFSNMDGKTEVSIDALLSAVPVSARIQWAIDREWPDMGAAAGLALASASVPTPGQPLTQQQAQVGSQTMIIIASEKYWAAMRGDYAWQVTSGIGHGAALIIAGNPASLFNASPYTAPENSDQVITPTVEISGNGFVGADGNTYLSVDYSVLGTVIQAISRDANSVDAIMSAYGAYLPTFLGNNISSDDQAITDLLAKSDCPALTKAASILAFIVDNALAGQGYVEATPETNILLETYMSIAGAGAGLAASYVDPGFGVAVTVGVLAVTLIDQFATDATNKALLDAENARKDTSQQTMTQGTDATIAAYAAFIQALMNAGYFDPTVISALSDRNPDLGLTIPPPGLQPGDTLDLTDPDIAKWLEQNLHIHPKTVLAAAHPGDPADDRYVVKVP